MFWLVLSFITFLYLFFRRYKKQSTEHDDSALAMISIFVICIAFGIMLWVASGAFTMKLKNVDVWKLKSDENIISFASGNRIDGDFFLGVGNVKEKICYFYMVEREEGFQIERIPLCSWIYVKESQNPPNISYWMGLYNGVWCRFFCTGFYHEKIIIEIPPNSIWKGYQIDIRKR